MLVAVNALEFYCANLMGKKGSSSWLTAVKRAFRSPTKDGDKRSSRRREDYDQEEDEEKVLNTKYRGGGVFRCLLLS